MRITFPVVEVDHSIPIGHYTPSTVSSVIAAHVAGQRGKLNDPLSRHDRMARAH